MQTLDLQPIADELAAVLTVLVPVLTAFAGWAVAQLGKSRKADKALTEGVKSLLRGQIIDLGLHYITAYAGVPNAAGTYGSAEEEQPGSVSELRSIQLVTVGPLTAGEAAMVAILAGSLRLGADRYSMLQVDAAHFAAAMTLSNGDAMQVMALAQRNGWDTLERYHSRFVL